MTDFHKIKNYYQHFDEWSRLDTPAGQLERQIVLEIIENSIKVPSEILDLGGGAGRYSYELARKGYQMHLADLSPDLIKIAQEKLSHFPGKDNIKSIRVANAIDLSDTENERYENVLLFGPLYHLIREAEIEACLNEVHRVLKPNGKLIASYIPYHCGLNSILDRFFRSPEQVNRQAFARVSQSGVFNNQSNAGFQEGKFIQTEDLLEMLGKTGFKKILLRSIRGIGYQKEKEILALEHTKPDFYQEILSAIHQSAGDIPIRETCGHAVYIGEKVT